MSKQYNLPIDQVYQNILNEIKKMKETGQYGYMEKPLEDIAKDINRTFHTDRFDESGRRELSNVLEALSFVRKDVGYCQGMNFIAGALINIFDSEEKAFWYFFAFLNNYDIRNLFVKNMPDYNLRVYQLNHYVKKYFPDVYYHFKNNKIPYDLFYSKWFITIFAAYLGFDVVAQCWLYFVIVISL
jgi:hypothetical protein